MPKRDHSRLLAHLSERYCQYAPRSVELQDRAKAVMVDGGSHALRLIEPFPPRITAARGAWLTDADGHQILDFWQGHMANLLGHNPQMITETLSQALSEGWGLQTGFTDELQIEVAELLCARVGAERVRFTSSGTLATLYAIMLARAFTGRMAVLKVGGGWHGGQPWGLKGVGFSAEAGFEGLDSAGLPDEVAQQVVVTRFNDLDRLQDSFREHGERLACFIVEPIMGSGGGMAATPEYLRTARDLCDRYGVLLILDEVIAGFRFHAGDTGALYGVHPDLAAFGKIIGGGMPLAAVAGRAAVLNLAGRAAGSRVKFSGGTYSAHPASMLAARTALHYIISHEGEIYPRLAALGEQARQGIKAAFAAENIDVYCTGEANKALPASSIVQVHFPYGAGRSLNCPDEALNPEVCDVTLADRVLRLALLLHDIHVVHGLGACTTAHSEADLVFLLDGFRALAHELTNWL
jgi:glutamate-1-semialdehyde 2,1-aminomutase